MNKTAHTKANFTQAATALVERFAQSRPMHANSLLISLYGDTICPRGDTIWLGSLIKLVEPLGINQRLVRTSVFRLAEKAILESKQVGRRSYYSLTDRAYRQFVSASKRIYAPQTQPWDEQWCLVFTSLGKLSTTQRDTLRKELVWLGFSRVTPGVYVHPMADIKEVEHLTRELAVEPNIAILKAQAMDAKQIPISNALISDCFDLGSSEQEYQTLIADFQGIYECAITEHTLDPQLCFLVKTLLIHRFRHILLKEPELPSVLISPNAASLQARALVGDLYKLICPAADDYFSSIGESDQGRFKAPEQSYFDRFKALDG